MKKLFIIFVLASLISSCGEDKRSPEVREEDSSFLPHEEHDSIQQEDVAQEKKDGVSVEKDVVEVPVPVTGGRYRKVSDAAVLNDCNCQCIDIDFDNPTEWCIVKDKVYITARCERTGDREAALYFVEASREENADRPFPWADFDRNTPIASITFSPDGTADLDWLGFNINGEIATDYAIYGKKTLEGTYKKD